MRVKFGRRRATLILGVVIWFSLFIWLTAASMAQGQPVVTPVSEQALANRLMREISEALQKDALILLLQQRVKDLEEKATAAPSVGPDKK